MAAAVGAGPEALTVAMRPAPLDHAGDPVRSTSVLNVANVLTVVRLLLVPVFAWLLLRERR